MRVIFLAVVCCMTIATASRGLPQPQSESNVALWASPDTTVATTTGSIVLNFGPSGGTQTGTSPPGALVTSVGLTYLNQGSFVTKITLWHQDSKSPVLVSAVLPPIGQTITFPFAGMEVSGSWYSQAVYDPSYALPVWGITVNWQLPPPPTPSPPSDAVVQGYKLDGSNGSLFSNAVISVDGASTGSANPYAARVSAHTPHQVCTTVPPGYSVAYSSSINSTSHPDASYVQLVSGNCVTWQNPQPGDYWDLWWKYSLRTELIMQSLTPILP